MPEREKGENMPNKIVVIKSTENSGKTTTIWLTFLELIGMGATVISFSNTYNGPNRTIPSAIPATPYDFVAEVLFNNKRIVIISHGDVPKDVNSELQNVLPTNPDFIICASRSQSRTGSTWDLFKTVYTNTMYERVCFWSEFTTNPMFKLSVKQPTVEAIIKYIS